jgi:hypothetical protein
MNFLHLDVWSRNATTTDFIVKIRDRGANGVIDTMFYWRTYRRR